jgi:hypothetical protein
MLTICIFVEFPGETVVLDGNCFVRDLGTQQEDESRNNVSRDKLYHMYAMTGSGFADLLNFT